MIEKMHLNLPKIKKEHWILVGEIEESYGFTRWTEFISDLSDEEPPNANLVDDDVYNIMYSSGTTGAPKGIVHTHYVRANYCTQFASAWRMNPESIVFHAGAIVFNGAMLGLMPWMYLGATYSSHTFDPAEVLNTIDQEKVTHMVMVPLKSLHYSIIQILILKN